jgi:hypothetical protein
VQGKEDATAAKANEALRRKAGQDQGLAREELLEKQMAKEAEQKRRGESGRGSGSIVSYETDR